MKTQEEDMAQSYASEGNYTMSHQTKPSTDYDILRDHARSVGYYEPISMILHHPEFSPNPPARVVATLGGIREAVFRRLLL